MSQLRVNLFLTSGFQIFLCNCLFAASLPYKGLKVKRIYFLYFHKTLSLKVLNISCIVGYLIFPSSKPIQTFEHGNVFCLGQNCSPVRIVSHLIPTTSCSIFSRCLCICFSRPVETFWPSLTRANMNSANTWWYALT